MSQVESVQTFVTEVDRSGISAILAQGGPPNPEALRAAVRFISGQNLSAELEGFVSEELVLVDGRMLNESDSGSYNVLLGLRLLSRAKSVLVILLNSRECRSMSSA